MLNALVNRLASVSVIGVDLGSSRLKAVEVVSSGGRLMLRRCAVISVEGGDSTSALAQLVREADIPAARVAVGLAAPEVIVKPVQFPPIPKKELAGAVQLEAEQAILNGHVLSDMAVDWHPLTSSNRKADIRGLLAVVPHTILAARLAAVQAAGLRPMVVDVEGLALWNAYWALVGVRESAPKTVLLMNIGARTTNLVIAKGPDQLILIRDLQLGAKAYEEGRQSDWVAEVRDSISYARAQTGLRSLDAAYVTGGGSGPSLIPLMKAAVAAPVTFWNPLNQLERTNGTPAVEKSQGPLLAVAIGLALRRPS